MSENKTTKDSEENSTVETNPWHPVPMLIGKVIVGNSDEFSCGGFKVRRENNHIVIYEKIEEASGFRHDTSELGAVEVFHDELGDTDYVYEKIGAIEDRNWDVSDVRECIWGGYR